MLSSRLPDTWFDLLFYIISEQRTTNIKIHLHLNFLVSWYIEKMKKNVNIYPITVVIFFIFWFPFHIHDVPGSAFCMWRVMIKWFLDDFSSFLTRFLFFCDDFLAQQSIFMHFSLYLYFFIMYEEKRIFLSLAGFSF